jgi:hypothetical protein
VITDMKTLLGILLFVLAVWAILNIVRSSASTGAKILWILFVLIFPLIGVIVWYFAGPKKA